MKASSLNFVLLGMLGLASAWSMTLGPAPLSVGDVWGGLVGTQDLRVILVVQEIRLPRLLLGLIVGAALGVSGAALQGLLRNPLAEPGIIGTSSCAALGAVSALYYGWAATFALALPLAGMAGAALGTLALLLLSGRNAGTLTMILTGIAISSLAGSMTSLAMNLSPTPYAVTEIVMWMMGSLKDRSMADVWLAAPFVALGLAMLSLTGAGLNALTLGEEAASSLGVNLSRLRVLVIVGAALAVGASVSAAGAVGFVGLIVPHLLRPLTGYRPSALLLPSALGGALLITGADIAVRLIPASTELMLGVVTALVGGPFFFVLILKVRKAHQ